MRKYADMKRYRVIALVAVGLILFSSGYGLRMSTANKNSAPDGVSLNESKQYPLLAKRIFIENPNDPIINFSQLRQQLKTYMSDNKIDGSLYFEYLPTGTSVRVDGDDMRLAASLIKLPAAMDLYRAAELGKINLDQTITLQQSWLDSGYGTLYQKGAGYQLTLRDAAKILLTESDNTALKAIAYTTKDSLNANDRAINAVDADISQNPDLSVSIGARSYSSFLKCLYFSCYVNHADSEEILTYLTESNFNNRLVAGIDDRSIKVAHKIGVANTTTQSDCGIVYIPKRNYVLCVMINGEDNATTNTHIATLSKLTYNFVNNR